MLLLLERSVIQLIQFLLRSSLHYYAYENRSYNVAEFATRPVKPYKTKAEKLINSQKRIQFSFRMSE